MFWPLEGMPAILRYISYCMPFTLPSISVRNIMAKGYSFCDQTVLVGFGVVSLWTVAGVFLGLKALQVCKYSRNT
jgi:ABC-type polysaccharide/polyol phosphate export permease